MVHIFESMEEKKAMKLEIRPVGITLVQVGEERLDLPNMKDPIGRRGKKILDAMATRKHIVQSSVVAAGGVSGWSLGTEGLQANTPVHWSLLAFVVVMVPALIGLCGSIEEDFQFTRILRRIPLYRPGLFLDLAMLFMVVSGAVGIVCCVLCFGKLTPDAILPLSLAFALWAGHRLAAEKILSR